MLSRIPWLGQRMLFDQLKRREFMALLGAAAATWPAAARGQQTEPAVVGFLSSLSQPATDPIASMWRRGLAETGHIEGKTIRVEYRYANGEYDRLRSFAAELVRQQVMLITAAGPPAALAAKLATTSIPIVFVVGLDPVAAGLVRSFNAPGGNATGMTLITGPLAQKRLEIVRELVPRVKSVPILLNPAGSDAVPELRDVQAAAQAIGLGLQVINASTPEEIDDAFKALAEQRAQILVTGADPLFTSRRAQLVEWAARIRLPTIYPFKEFVTAGGLMSYGSNIVNSYRQAGIYAGRILKGARPDELPVMQPTTFELVINLKVARALDIEIPATLHARSDEVIE